MTSTTTHDVSVPIRGLLSFGEELLTRYGVPDADARLTCDILLQADLRGVESHGMAHLVDFYVRRLQRAEINPTPDVHVVRETPSAATVDGDGGLGFVVGHRAMERAIDKARETGVGIVSVGNSTHCGAGAYYAMMALEHDMIGLSMTTGGRLMAPPGGRTAALGTNVISFAAPAPRGFPYVLDMATTVVAAGKFEIAARRERSVPEGWAIDANGQPLTDPASFRQDGALLPLGGDETTASYKGFGLAMMVDILCGALSGFGTSTEIPPGTAAHGFGALRIDAFQPLPDFLEVMGRAIDNLKRVTTEDGEPVRIPGELEHRLAEERRAAGAVPLHPKIIAGYREIADELGIEFDLEPES